jgi:hypothetical protein
MTTLQPAPAGEVSPASSRSTVRLYRRILDELERLRALCRNTSTLELRAADVSAWSVGEHVEHLLLSDRAILGEIERRDAEGGPDAGGRAGLLGRLVLWLRFIPRGKGRAPDFARPGRIGVDALEAGLAELGERVRKLEPRLGRIEAARWRFPHPALGSLTALQGCDLCRSTTTTMEG